ncbi:MAG TPA: Lon-like protease helical domain-containing protein [Burkholderiaceae bacterium]|nr:Lon-like protease helical domain-containing protein [Burkholderiaceae bacterium]
MPASLSRAQLRRSADLSALPFETTAELASTDAPVGQDRALDALRFGTRIGAPGFNLFVIGATDAGLDRAVKALLEQKAATEPAPVDWVYVSNFDGPQRPRALQLPPGRGPVLRDAIRDLIEDLEVALPAAFESSDYQSRRASIDEAFRKKQEEAFAALTADAAARRVAIVRAPMGFGVAPLGPDGDVLKTEAFNALPEEQRKAIQATLQGFEKRLEEVLQQIPRWDKVRRDEVRALDRETAKYAVGHSIDETKAPFADLPQVLDHLEKMRNDIPPRRCSSRVARAVLPGR